jgi:hypothetical protein
MIFKTKLFDQNLNYYIITYPKGLKLKHQVQLKQSLLKHGQLLVRVSGNKV